MATGNQGTGLASNPGSPFRILSRSFGDKIRNREPGFEARTGYGMGIWSRHLPHATVNVHYRKEVEGEQQSFQTIARYFYAADSGTYKAYMLVMIEGQAQACKKVIRHAASSTVLTHLYGLWRQYTLMQNLNDKSCMFFVYSIP